MVSVIVTLGLVCRRLDIALPYDVIRYIVKLLKYTRLPVKENEPLHYFKNYKQKYKRSICSFSKNIYYC